MKIVAILIPMDGISTEELIIVIRLGKDRQVPSFPASIDTVLHEGVSCCGGTSLIRKSVLRVRIKENVLS
jgi:hypothetical protein